MTEKNGYVTYRALIGIVMPLIFGLVGIATGLASWIWSVSDTHQDRRLERIEKQLERHDDRIERAEKK